MSNFESHESLIYSAPFDVAGGSLSDTIPLTKCSHKVIYDMYDKLMEKFPEFITKTVLDEASSCEIRRYTFRNPEQSNPPLKACIIASIHGYEQGAAFVTAQFFKLMLTSNDKLLSHLKRNVVFDVIPVANPWGFDHNKRKNENEVDLNRNFAPYFNGKNEKNSPEHAGEYPESETETKSIIRFLEENSDTQLVLDYHNIAKGYPLFYVYSQRDVELAKAVFAPLSKKWAKEYPSLPQNESLGRTRPNGHEGMLADHVIEKGLWVLTMETPWCMPVIGKEQYDLPTVRCSIDVLANTLLTVFPQNE
ncbi:MAG: DUF2817 domain-containing protein [Clostridia bacterium]|nr:DUF2817 domain-containing protein [Clostridia bacterium]MBR2388879.1 DUF2817 domain-containing protein [Clostridia bacterium]